MVKPQKHPPRFTTSRHYHLGVSPQDAVVLTWMMEARLPITFALRSATSTSQVPTDPVNLQYITETFRIDIRDVWISLYNQHLIVFDNCLLAIAFLLIVNNSNGQSLMAQGDGTEITILLVDDIAETRESIKKLLAFEPDFKVVGSASNGREGVEQAKELRPDIIIMDINMPDMDGLEAASLVTKAVPTAGVIMMSVQNDSDYLNKAMLAGARFFLSKPVNMDQLYTTIRTVYQQYEPMRRQDYFGSGALDL